MPSSVRELFKETSPKRFILSKNGTKTLDGTYMEDEMSYSQNSIKLGRIDDILFKKIDLMFRKNTRKVLNWSISFGKTAKVSLIRLSSLGKVDF